MKVLALVNGIIKEVDVVSGGAGIPLRVPPDETYTIPENNVVVFPEELNLEGDLELDGLFFEES